MRQNTQSRSLRSAITGVLAFTGIALLLVTPAAAQTAAAALYERAMARETEARKIERPAVATLRSIAAAYENVVRRYPRSGYADNALWQGASVLDVAFDLSGQARDQTQARRLLNWLAREYPKSALAKQASARLVSGRPAAVAAASPRPAASSARSTAVFPTNSSSGAAALAASALPNQILPAPVTLTSITMSPLPKGDRLTFELSRESAYTATRAPKSSFVTFTLPNVGLSAAALSAVSAIKGALIQSVRLTPKNGGTEVEIRLVGQPRHSAFPLYGPYRLVMDVESDSPITRESSPVPVPVVADAPPARSVVAETVAPPPPAPVSAPRTMSAPTTEATTRPITPASTTTGGYSLARQLGLGVSRIVIDPGHGGHDPGAQAHGVAEAELVLDVALRLERLLQAQPGFEVVLTRRTNEFIALEARTALANRESADLFLSIHANASGQSDTRGVETYFLNFSSNAQAESVAARENAASAQSMRLLPGLVKAITLNNKRTESKEFAAMIQASLIKQLKVQNKNVKDLGVKQAPFVVLIGAEMPSVLAEISFLTNKSDANLLKQQSYRQRVAQALADAVLRYQGSLKKVTAVAATR